MNLIKPNLLMKGDTIGILATSSCLEDELRLKRAVKFFEHNGYYVKLSKNVNSNFRGMAGNDNVRLSEMHDMFGDDDISAIIALRGGYGALRLINEIDYEYIRRHPKIFCGYSDITILNAMFLKRSGLITYSGPMATTDFGKDELCPYTIVNFFKAVSKDDFSCLGDTSGKRFWGGNLSSLVSLCGIDFIPDFKFDLFLEDVNEPVYKVDRMLRQLMNLKKFRKNIRSLNVGDFLKTDNKNDLNLLFEEIAKQLGISYNKNFPVSHGDTKATIPYGAIL